MDTKHEPKQQKIVHLVFRSFYFIWFTMAPFLFILPPIPFPSPAKWKIIENAQKTHTQE